MTDLIKPQPAIAAVVGGSLAVSLAELPQLVADCEPDIAVNTRDEIAEYVAALRTRRDVESARQALIAQRFVEWAMGRRWPANRSGVNRTDDRPLLTNKGGNSDSEAWGRVYLVAAVDQDDIIERQLEELSYASFRPDRDIIDSNTHVTNNSGENEWYTPLQFIEAAHQALDGIDLDPASSTAANEVVKAARYYSIDDDGLTQPWHGTVWMNPPYGGPLIGKFIDKLVTEYVAGRTTQAIVLVNNGTETSWFQTLAEHSTAFCFPAGRIRFWYPNRPSLSPLQGQVFTYLGPDPHNFIEAFAPFGTVK